MRRMARSRCLHAISISHPRFWDLRRNRTAVCDEPFTNESHGCTVVPSIRPFVPNLAAGLETAETRTTVISPPKNETRLAFLVDGRIDRLLVHARDFICR